MTLEQLLNKLIERWRKPRGKKRTYIEHESNDFEIYLWERCTWELDDVNIYSLRDLVSKESWLWQFVCEKLLVYKKITYNLDDIINKYYDIMTPNYRIMLSSIQDDLEKFLLDNIKIDE